MARQIGVGFFDEIRHLVRQRLCGSKISAGQGIVDLGEQSSEFHERPAPSEWSNVGHGIVRYGPNSAAELVRSRTSVPVRRFYLDPGRVSAMAKVPGGSSRSRLLLSYAARDIPREFDTRIPRR